ncbi:hypothetical protein MOVS_02425 [Moraxella ovis]|nr:hypothetical protein MOVS_02425 [Moraxella ovis]
MASKKQVLAKAADPTNYIFGMTVQDSDKGAEYIAAVKSSYDHAIGRINSELKLYNDKDELIVEATQKAKKTQAEYDAAQRAVDNLKKQIGAIDDKIKDINLTAEDEGINDTKNDKQKELEDAEAKKAELEDELATKEKEAQDAKAALDNADLTDKGQRGIAHGHNAFASGVDAIAIGTNSTATRTNAIAIGADAKASGVDAIAIGAGTTVTGQESIAIGKGHTVTGNNSTVIGDPNTVSGNNVFVGGNNNTVESDNVMVIGNNVNVADGLDNAVVLGNNSAPAVASPTASIEIRGTTHNFAGTNPTSTVSVGSVGNERQITNVAAGRVTDSSTDAINGSQLYAVTDALNNLTIKTGDMSWIVSADGNSYTKTVKNAEEVKFIGQNGILITGGNNGITREITVKGTLFETKTNKDGSYTITITQPNGDKEDLIIKNGEPGLQGLTGPQGPQGLKGDTGPKGKDGRDAAAEVLAGENTVVEKVVTTLDNGDINTTYTMHADKTTVTQGDGITITHTATKNDAGVTVNDYKVEIDQPTKDKIQKGIDDAETADAKAVRAQQTADANTVTINKGFDVKTQDGTSTNYQLGDTVTITGGSNTLTKTDGGNVVVHLNDDIGVNSVKANQVTVGPVNITNEGINAGNTTIANVAPGRIAADSTDAVNGSQLLGVYNHVDSSINNMKTYINNVEDQLEAGIAGNNAAASLPQVMMPGKSMVAVALGGYRDKNAVAVGYSRLSDNGRYTLKSHLNADTEKNLGYGIGMGFTW